MSRPLTFSFMDVLPRRLARERAQVAQQLAELVAAERALEGGHPGPAFSIKRRDALPDDVGEVARGRNRQARGERKVQGAAFRLAAAVMALSACAGVKRFPSLVFRTLAAP